MCNSKGQGWDGQGSGIALQAFFPLQGRDPTLPRYQPCFSNWIQDLGFVLKTSSMLFNQKKEAECDKSWETNSSSSRSPGRDQKWLDLHWKLDRHFLWVVVQGWGKNTPGSTKGALAPWLCPALAFTALTLIDSVPANWHPSQYSGFLA